MKALRRGALAGASALLATLGAVTLSAPAAHAANYVNCPATEPGFILGYSYYGVSGVDTGHIYREDEVGQFTSTCHYSGDYYYATIYGTVHPGRSCTWQRDYWFIGDPGPRTNVTCP